MTDSDAVIAFKEREGKPGGGKGLLSDRKKSYTVGSTDKVPMICYEETEATQMRRCGAFMGGQGPKARTIAYSETVSPSLKSAPSGGNTIPDVVYQNTGHGWRTESTVCQTIRTPCGGDAPKANLIVEELNVRSDDP